MQIYVSTSCLSNRYNLPQILDIYEGLGIKNVEMGVCVNPNLDISKIMGRYDFNYIIHHYFPPPKEPFIINLASQNKQILGKSMEQIMTSIDFCSDFDIRFFSFHAGFRTDPNMSLQFSFDNIPQYESSFRTFKDSIAKISDYAKNVDVRLAIENNVLSEYNLVDGKNKILLLCEAWEFEKLFKDITSKNVGILLDIGHLKVTSNLLKFDANEFIHRLKNNIWAVHMHDNDGRMDEHNCPKKGCWSLDVAKNHFKNTDVPMVLECRCTDEKELEATLMSLRL